MLSIRVIVIFQTLLISEVLSGIFTPFITTLERSFTTCDGDTVTFCNTSIKKHNRTSPYMLYIYAAISKPLDKNATLTMKSYEWKDNQFKKSIFSFDKSLCDYIEKDKLYHSLAGNFAELPKKCPFKMGDFRLEDFWIRPGQIPVNFPLSKWKLEFAMKHKETGKIIGSFELQFRVEQLVKKGRNQ